MATGNGKVGRSTMLGKAADAEPPRWMRDMPSAVLFGSRTAVPIDVWCAENGKPRPALLEVAAERLRRKQKQERRAKRANGPAPA